MEGGCGWVWVGGQVLLSQGGTTPDAHGLRGAVRHTSILCKLLRTHPAFEGTTRWMR